MSKLRHCPKCKVTVAATFCPRCSTAMQLTPAAQVRRPRHADPNTYLIPDYQVSRDARLLTRRHKRTMMEGTDSDE